VRLLFAAVAVQPITEAAAFFVAGNLKTLARILVLPARPPIGPASFLPLWPPGPLSRVKGFLGFLF
jgi:hypothetical protein